MIRTSTYNRILLATVAPVAALALAGTAHADAAPGASASNGGISDIVVTARRTGEKLQTIPVAVTALSGAMIQERQIHEVTELARATPSLSIGTGGTGPASIVYLTIRGETQNSPNSVSDSAVGVYIDGVYVARPMVGNLGFLDMASAEVLRGPQGTLFGRNTTGGALNLTTNQPTHTFQGELKVGLGNYSQRLIQGMVNIPISDELAARFVGAYDEHAGYFANNSVGFPSSGIAQGAVKGDYYARGTLKWEPKALPVVVTVTGDYSRYRDTGNASAISYTIVPDFAGFVNPYFTSAGAHGGNWQTTYGSANVGTTYYDAATAARINDPHNFTTQKATSATVAWDATDNIKVKSITAYRESYVEDSLDLIGVPYAGASFLSAYANHQFTEELSVFGRVNDQINYTTGVYYFVEKGTEQSLSSIFGGLVASDTYSLYRSASEGAYFQANYHPTEKLALTAGIRYTWDQRSVDRDSSTATPGFFGGDGNFQCGQGPNAGSDAIGGLFPTNCHQPNNVAFNYPSWTASADYELSHGIFAYLKTSGSAMSGGFNTRPVPSGVSQSFRPEFVKDLEAGLKADFLDHHLRTNIAAYMSRRSGVQNIVNVVIPPATLTQYTGNQGIVNAKGFEFEATALPMHGLELNGSLSYFDGHYQPGSRTVLNPISWCGASACPSGTPPTDSAVLTVDRSGDPVAQAPKWTWSVAATQTLEFEPGKLALHVDFSYVSDRAFDRAPTLVAPSGASADEIAAIGRTNAGNAAFNLANTIHGYGLLNARATFTLNHPGVEVTVWGKNLANQANFTNTFGGGLGLGGTIEQFQGSPRTYGVTVGVKW